MFRRICKNIQGKRVRFNLVGTVSEEGSWQKWRLMNKTLTLEVEIASNTNHNIRLKTPKSTAQCILPNSFVLNGREFKSFVDKRLIANLHQKPIQYLITSRAGWSHRRWRRFCMWEAEWSSTSVSRIHYHLAERSDGLFQKCPQWKSIGKSWSSVPVCCLLLVVGLCVLSVPSLRQEARQCLITENER